MIGLLGGMGPDTLIGGIGHDTLSGFEGNDVLVGAVFDENGSDADGSDFLNGGDGNDMIVAGAGGYFEWRYGRRYRCVRSLELRR